MVCSKTKLKTINADLSELTIERIYKFMTQKGIKYFSDGVREYISNLESESTKQSV